jgi:hypothetical protein
VFAEAKAVTGKPEQPVYVAIKKVKMNEFNVRE